MRTKKITKPPLNHEEFVQKLNKLNINKKEFSELSNIGHQTVINWSSKPIPSWVDSWLKYYSDAQKFYIISKQLNNNM